MDTVIFACVHNAGRSQMAAAFFNQLADPRAARAASAGTQPGERVHLPADPRLHPRPDYVARHRARFAGLDA